MPRAPRCWRACTRASSRSTRSARRRPQTVRATSGSVGTCASPRCSAISTSPSTPRTVSKTGATGSVRHRLRSRKSLDAPTRSSQRPWSARGEDVRQLLRQLEEDGRRGHVVEHKDLEVHVRQAHGRRQQRRLRRVAVGLAQLEEAAPLTGPSIGGRNHGSSRPAADWIRPRMSDCSQSPTREPRCGSRWRPRRSSAGRHTRHSTPRAPICASCCASPSRGTGCRRRRRAS